MSNINNRKIYPTSKVIQISTAAVENCNETQTCMITTALCEDGSVWENRLGYAGWYCLLKANQETKDGE